MHSKSGMRLVHEPCKYIHLKKTHIFIQNNFFSKQSDNIHCKSKQLDSSNWCSDLVNPTTAYNVTKNIDLETGVGGISVQIKPQRIRLDIRKGEEQTIPFEYARASNYPLDLYYIMDLSHTMKSHKDKLSELGDKLVEVMRSSTTDFRLGFGSFVDKPKMPFTQTGPD